MTQPTSWVLSVYSIYYDPFLDRFVIYLLRNVVEIYHCISRYILAQEARILQLEDRHGDAALNQYKLLPVFWFLKATTARSPSNAFN